MYKDRGIIKWQPFDALTGFRDSINNMIYKNNKKEKKILLEDKLEEMDYIIKEARAYKKEVSLEYYEDGYYKIMYGFIKKVDFINKKVILNNNIDIIITNITDITIL